jgi:hypothetical protein
LHLALIGTPAKVGRRFAGDDAAVGKPGVALADVIGIGVGIKIAVMLASPGGWRISLCALGVGGW